MNDAITIAKGKEWIHFPLRYANRHGLIAGATGTGKTVTLQSLIEQFSRRGVPVVVADVKGDLAGLSQAGVATGRVQERIEKLGLTDFQPQATPVVFWDLFGESGHPVRTTISEMGPLLLSRLLRLNETQSGVLQIAFELADDEGLLLLDIKDLRALLEEVGKRSQELQQRYGNVSSASIGAIQRALLTLETQGGERLFGEPALRLADLMRTALNGNGIVSVLCADKLLQTPRVYSTLLLWLLSELFEQLPEIGDSDKPRAVFFFDEAHLLFDEAPPVFLERVEQVVRLIRSKGIGVYFVTQHPLDIPERIGAQLGNRVQHALRAFTPKEQKALRAAAESFRCEDARLLSDQLLELVPGEAIVSFLGDDGAPQFAERAFIAPPMSRIGAITPLERTIVVQESPVGTMYDQSVDRESAYEKLKGRATERGSSEGSSKGRQRQSFLGSVFTSAVRSIATSIGRQIARGVLGTIGGKRF